MKAFTLQFTNKNYSTRPGIDLEECIDCNHNRVIGIPVPIGTQSVLVFPELQEPTNVSHFKIKDEEAFMHSEYHDEASTAAIYIPENSILVYSSLTTPSPEKQCLGGNYKNHRNTNALLLLEEASCTFLSIITKTRHRELAVLFDGSDLIVNTKSSVPLPNRYSFGDSEEPTFGTKLSDLLKKK